VPIMCRLCPKKPMPVIIYKYSMEQHWKDEHDGVQMDSATKKDIALDPKELGWVTQLLKRKTCKG
jgi:hypothetical protein